MIVAELKKRENIVEYVIYMKQVQEILRACKFDINKIDELIIKQYQVVESERDTIRNWYSDLIISMKNEKVEESGDLAFIKEIIENLNAIHLEMLQDKSDLKHKDLYMWAEPNIKEYKKLSKSESNNEVEIAISAVYSLLLLRLQKKAISDDTAQAMQTFSNLLANIALQHKTKEN